MVPLKRGYDGPHDFARLSSEFSVGPYFCYHFTMCCQCRCIGAARAETIASNHAHQPVRLAAARTVPQYSSAPTKVPQSRRNSPWRLTTSIKFRFSRSADTAHPLLRRSSGFRDPARVGTRHRAGQTQSLIWVSGPVKFRIFRNSVPEASESPVAGFRSFE